MGTTVVHYAIFSVSFVLVYILVQGQQQQQQLDITELPHCIENNDPGLVLVSTLDGKVSALNTAGILLWQMDTGPGPLLTSNIHELELGRDDEWTRIIPSLSGGLYKFSGSKLDAMPVTAETLLKTSFRYSDDIVMAGGLEVRTYGVELNSGKCLYVCSSQNCKNMTDEIDMTSYVAVIERSTRTVRAIEAKSGAEKWNFSVGTHDIKIPQMDCINIRVNYEFNISAVLPKGKLSVGVKSDLNYHSWIYEFASPIVDVWNFNGRDLNSVDVFKSSEFDSSPAIYLGMHNKQLYIHESASLQTALQTHSTSTPSTNLIIPWKPIKADDTALVPLGSDSTTAISVLYGSEYANGNGYYLYTESLVEDNENCQNESNNKTKVIKVSETVDDNYVITSIWYWWKEVCLISITTAVAFNVMFRSFSRNRQPKEKIIFVDRPVPSETSSNGGRTISESSENSFTSRFTNDFETVSCLGKGGFGVVFKVRQKIDECNYAIKRITLPERQKSRDRVMREVKALAKLDHQNIVRYYNSWMETPPAGWHLEHDKKWLTEANLSYFGTNSVFTTSHKRSSSVVINVNHSTKSKECTDSYIVFEASSGKKETFSSKLSTNTTTTQLVSEHSQKKINWRRPSRRPHSLDLTKSQSISLPESPSPVFLYIQMQLCREKSLKDWLHDNKTRDFGEVLDIFKQILSAVEYVHLQGLIHRDLKPSNIFFSLEGQVKVGDFGLVTDMQETPENEFGATTSPRGHTNAVGTRLYMSPEQFIKKTYNYKVDIYSLGLIFFELLVPFSTDMERISTLTNVRDKKYPTDFKTKYHKEYELLNMMLCDNPDQRLTTIGIRARPPINTEIVDSTNTKYHFNLPLGKRSSEVFT